MKPCWVQKTFEKGADACGGPEKKHPRVKGPKDVWIERTYDYVVASGSLKTAKSSALGGKKREGDEGMERAEAAEGGCCLVTIEKGCQEGAQKRKE